jgi:hypothetical protein
MFGTNSTLPTLTILPGSGVGTYGKAGIGTTGADKIFEVNLGTAEAVRYSYNAGTGSATTYMDTTIDSAGVTTFTGAGSAPGFTFSHDVSVPDEAYGAGWNGSLEVPTKNAVYDKIETLAGATVYTSTQDDVTAADTNFVDVTGCVFSYVANATYQIWIMGLVSPTVATTGCGFAFNTSSAVTHVNLIHFNQFANTGAVSGGHSIADDASVGVSQGFPGTGENPVVGFGRLVTTSNTGTAQLRFRSEVAAVNTCKAGLTMKVERIA